MKPPKRGEPAQLLAQLERHARCPSAGRLEAHLVSALEQHALERRALELAAPTRSRAGSRRPRRAEVGAHARPRSVRITVVQRAVVDVLHALDARPPARQVVRIGDARAQTLLRRRGDRALRRAVGTVTRRRR